MILDIFIALVWVFTGIICTSWCAILSKRQREIEKLYIETMKENNATAKELVELYKNSHHRQ